MQDAKGFLGRVDGRGLSRGKAKVNRLALELVKGGYHRRPKDCHVTESMMKYVSGNREDGIYLDPLRLAQSRQKLHAVGFATGRSGGCVLWACGVKEAWVGNQQAVLEAEGAIDRILKETGGAVKGPVMMIVRNRWLPGFLTNWGVVHNRLEIYHNVSQQGGTVPKNLVRGLEAFHGKMGKSESPARMVLPSGGHAVPLRNEAKRALVPVVGVGDLLQGEKGMDVVIPGMQQGVQVQSLFSQTLCQGMVEGVLANVQEWKNSQSGMELAKLGG